MERRLINLDFIHRLNSIFLICFMYIPASSDLRSLRLWWRGTVFLIGVLELETKKYVARSKKKKKVRLILFLNLFWKWILAIWFRILSVCFPGIFRPFQSLSVMAKETKYNLLWNLTELMQASTFCSIKLCFSCLNFHCQE